MFLKRFMLFLVLLVLSFSSVVFADESKQARKNDVASDYILNDRGDFYRVVDGNKCQITTKVEDFKISGHPNDVAMVYFIKEGDLYVLRNDPADFKKRPCPPAATKNIMSNVKKVSGKYKYNVVPNQNTTIVNMALNIDGTFVAWDDRDVAFRRDRDINDYRLNSNFGTDKPFKSYVAFLYTFRNKIVKLKGNEYNTSVETKESYDSLADFMEDVRVQTEKADKR